MEGEKSTGVIQSIATGLGEMIVTTIRLISQAIFVTTTLFLRGIYWVGEISVIAFYNLVRIVSKSGYITMKSGGKAIIFSARKAFPRQPDETIWQYRRRMAKLGFRVSMYSGKIVMKAIESESGAEFGTSMALDLAGGSTQGLAYRGIKKMLKSPNNSMSTTQPKPNLVHGKMPVQIHKQRPPRSMTQGWNAPAQPPQPTRPKVPISRQPIPPGLNVAGSPPPIPPGLNAPGSPPPIPPGLNAPGSPPPIPPGLFKSL